jgi:hypothetical protein
VAKKKIAPKVSKPKYSDLKDVVTQISVEDTNLEVIKSTFKYALPEIGRQIAKNNGYQGALLTKAASISAQIVDKIDTATPLYTNLRSLIAEHLGYAVSSWPTEAGAGCYQTVDLEDLYDNHNLEVELHLVITRKPIDKDLALKKYGVK